MLLTHVCENMRNDELNGLGMALLECYAEVDACMYLGEQRLPEEGCTDILRLWKAKYPEATADLKKAKELGSNSKELY